MTTYLIIGTIVVAIGLTAYVAFFEKEEDKDFHSYLLISMIATLGIITWPLVISFGVAIFLGKYIKKKIGK